MSTIVVTLDSLTNPRSTAQTSSFTIETSDEEGNTIEYINSGVTIIMTHLNELIGFRCEPIDGTNGATTQYLVTITANSPYVDGDRVIFTFPPEITFSGTTTCSAGTANTAVSCSLSGSTLTTTINTFS